jgi:EF hand domain-containing protein
MQKPILALAAAAFILGYGATAAKGQGASGGGQGYDGGWGYGRWHMMRGGFTGGGPGMMGNPIMMRMIFATDGDGAISLQEFQAAHERIFKAMDTNKDGRLISFNASRGSK